MAGFGFDVDKRQQNSFDALKLSANEICTKLNNKQELAVKLINELSIPLSIEVPFVFKHFIYKDIRLNQFVMSELPTHEFSSFQFLKCYNELKVSQAKIIKHDNNLNYKKLTYLQDRDITGFMLMDKYYEFYCIIERSSEQETITSKKLIQISSQIIRWCKRTMPGFLLLYNKYHTGTYTHRHIHTQTHIYI